MLEAVRAAVVPEGNHFAVRLNPYPFQEKQRMSTRPFTVVRDHRLKAVRTLPSEYFLSLSPDQRAAALKNHIFRLSENMNQFEATLIARDIDMSDE